MIDPDHPLRRHAALAGDVADYLSGQARLNRWLGAERILLRHALPIIQAAHRDVVDSGQAERAIKVLDLGTGGADLARALARACRREEVPVVITAIDGNRDVVDQARASCDDYPEIDVAVADIFRLGNDESQAHRYDVVYASSVFCHYSPETCLGLLATMGRLARRGFVVVDWMRHPVATVGANALARMTSNPFLREELESQPLGSLTWLEWGELAHRSHLPDILLHGHAPFRIALVWKRLVAMAPEVDKPAFSIARLLTPPPTPIPTG